MISHTLPHHPAPPLECSQPMDPGRTLLLQASAAGTGQPPLTLPAAPRRQARPRAQAAAPPPPPVIQQSTFTNFASPENTIDEPVWDTIKRDVVTIGRNLKSVLIPVQGEFVGREAALRNWDLWVPLVSSRRDTEACCRHSPWCHSLPAQGCAERW